MFRLDILFSAKIESLTQKNTRRLITLEKNMATGTTPAFTITTGDGTTTVALGSVDNGNSIYVQPDGKIVAGGSNYYDFALVRYNSDGSLDTTFGNNSGIALTDFGLYSEYVTGLFAQPDGKIIAVGTSSDGSASTFALARYNTDGTPDTGFGGGSGKVTSDFGSYDYGLCGTLQSDGKIIVSGLSWIDEQSYSVLVRYNNDGSIDTAFGTDGRVLTQFGAFNQTNCVTVQDDGKILTAGVNGAIARYNSDGSLDITFDSDGKMFGNFNSASSLVVQEYGKILVGGTLSGNFTVIRYNTDGSLDTSFGGGSGQITTDLGSYDYGNSIILQDDAKILLAGGSNENFALARYNSDGSPDTGFGDGAGKITYDFGSTDYGRSAAVQTDGKILMSGSTYDGNIFGLSVIRYNSDGSLDTSFGSPTSSSDASADSAISVTNIYSTIPNESIYYTIDAPHGTHVHLYGLMSNGEYIDIGGAIVGNDSTTVSTGNYGITPGTYELFYRVLDESWQPTTDYIAVNATVVVEGVAPTASVYEPYTVIDSDLSGTFSANDEIHLGFSEIVVPGSITLDSLTLSNGHNFGTGAYLVTDNNYWTDGVTVVLGENASIQAEDTVTIGSHAIVDFAGIKAVSDLTYTVDSTLTNESASYNPTITINEDTAKVFATDDFTANNPLSGIMITALPTAGSLTFDGVAVTLNQEITAADISAGKLIFTPEANANGTDYASFGFKVSDGTVYSATANIMTFDVAAVNDSPIPVLTAGNGTLIVVNEDNENNAHTGNPDGDFGTTVYGDDYNHPIEFNINVSESTLPQTSALLTITSWDVDYYTGGQTDEVYFNGNFIGILQGWNETTSQTIFNINPAFVKEGNNLVEIHVGVDDPGGWYTTINQATLLLDETVAVFGWNGTEDSGAAVAFTVPADSFLDADGDALEYTATMANGDALPAWLLFDPHTLTFSGSVPENLNGVLPIRILATDGMGTASIDYQFVIDPINDAPAVASAVLLPSVDEDSGSIAITPSQLLANAADVDGDTLSITGLTASEGTLLSSDDGTWSLTPSANYHGTITLSYSISDGIASTPATAIQTVSALNDLPSAAHAMVDVAENGFFSGILPAAADFDGDPIHYSLKSAPYHGDASVGADGSYTYTPDADFSGIDLFTYLISDGNGGDTSYTVRVQIDESGEMPSPSAPGVTLSDVAKLYVATFNRAPDSAGLDYWVYDSGLQIEEIAQSFFDQSETQKLYPAGTQTDSFVASVYQNLFNRDPEQAGLDYWVGELDSGKVAKQNFILAVMNGALDTEISLDATILANKMNIGLIFAQEGLNDVEKANTAMYYIDAAASSVEESLWMIMNNSFVDIVGTNGQSDPF